MSEKARILVVEDEAIVAMSLQARLENLRYAVVGVVASGEEAIERAADLSPDLILNGEVTIDMRFWWWKLPNRPTKGN